MAELKTRENDADMAGFLASVADDRKVKFDIPHRGRIDLDVLETLTSRSVETMRIRYQVEN